MFRSRLFLRLFLAYGVVLSALLVASILLRELFSRSATTWVQSPWFLAGVLFIIALGVSLFITYQLTAPLVRLAKIGQGLANLKEPPESGPRDEVRTLAQVIDSLHGELAQQSSRQDHERDLSRAVLRCMVECVIVLDAEEKIQFLNEAARRLLKLETHFAIGKKLWEVTRHRGLINASEAVLRSDEPYSAELELELPEQRHLKVQGTKLVGTGRSGAVLVLHDVTALRKLERVRQDFFTNVSHELKTPLASIQATVETLLDGALHDSKHNVNFLGRVNENVERLNRLVNDLLTLSRIESGQQPINLTALPLTPALEACIQRQEHRAQARHQELYLAKDSENVTALADDLALDLILDNLVDNAIKYTQEGGKVTLRASVVQDEARIEIKDNGHGIGEKDLTRIFERFFRADRARDRQDHGTGLGLSIVKHLVQAQSGRVDVESSLGQGSKFIVTLPLAKTKNL